MCHHRTSELDNSLAQGPKGRALAHEQADGLISLGAAAEHGFETCLVSVNGTVLADGEDADSPRVRAAVAPLLAVGYHKLWSGDPQSVRALPGGDAWLAGVEQVPAHLRHLSVHRGHNLDISNGHDQHIEIIDARRSTFTGTRDELRARVDALEAAGATGVIFGTSGADIERELRAFAEVAGL